MSNTILERVVASLSAKVKKLITPSLRERLVDVIALLVSRRLVTHVELEADVSVRRWTFGEPEVIEFDPPAFGEPIPPEIERLIGTHRCPQPYVLEVPEVLVKGEYGLLLDRDGRYITDNMGRLVRDERNIRESYGARTVAYDVLYGFERGIVPDVRSRPFAREEAEVAIPLLTRHAMNYTHWTQECLTKLEGLEAYMEVTDEDPVILIPPDPPQFITDSLTLLGFDNYVEWDHHRLRIQRAVLPSVRRCRLDSGGFIRMISGLRWIRDRALANLPRGGPDSFSPHVFISREDATTRRIKNRERVIDTLREYGFESYVLSELPYADQVRLFAQAELVVGTHGAGMINTMYGTETSVLELYGSHYLPANYELAQGLGLDYGCLGCVPSGEDLVVDTGELVRAIEALQ